MDPIALAQALRRLNPESSDPGAAVAAVTQAAHTAGTVELLRRFGEALTRAELVGVHITQSLTTQRHPGLRARVRYETEDDDAQPLTSGERLLEMTIDVESPGQPVATVTATFRVGT